jgi:hypothetical protein
VNFFHQWWPELLQDDKNPFLYVFETPLIVARKAKQSKYWYNEDYHKFDSEAHKGWDITRAKGLAALKKPDWKMLLAEPKLIDDGDLKESSMTVTSRKRSTCCSTSKRGPMTAKKNGWVKLRARPLTSPRMVAGSRPSRIRLMPTRTPSTA